MIGWIIGITIAGIALLCKLDSPTTPVIVSDLAFFVLLTIKAIR
jgi:hypothetical protein